MKNERSDSRFLDNLLTWSNTEDCSHMDCMPDYNTIILLNNGTFHISNKYQKQNCAGPTLIFAHKNCTLEKTNTSKAEVKTVKYLSSLFPFSKILDTKFFTANELSMCCGEKENFRIFNLDPEILNHINTLFDEFATAFPECSDNVDIDLAKSILLDIYFFCYKVFEEFDIFNICSCEISSRSYVEFRKIIKFINLNFSQRITLDQVYNDTRINRNHIEKLFKQFTNGTFYQYKRKLWYIKATMYLMLTDLQIRQISPRLGFNTPTNFSKAYKLIAGTLPGEIRKTKYNVSKQVGGKM